MIACRLRGSPPVAAPGALCPLSVRGGDVGAVTVVSAVAGRLPSSPAPSLTQVTPQPRHTMAATNKCLARSNKFRTRAIATKKRRALPG